MMRLDTRSVVRSGLARATAIAAAATLAGGVAHADGIDLFAFFARAGHASSDAAILGTVAALMLVNYALNLAVVGLPAIAAGAGTRSVVMLDLVWLTALGQVADRVAAVLAVLVAFTVFPTLEDPQGWWLFFALNFLLAALSVGALAFRFLRRRWKLTPRPSWRIAALAALLTNPAWAMLLWLT